MYNDKGQPLKKYSPLSPDYENTPRFQKQLIMFKNEQNRTKLIMEYISQIGLDNYLNLQAKEKEYYISKFIKNHKTGQKYRNTETNLLE